MARSDLEKLAERELKPYGIGRKDLSTVPIGMEAYELIWRHNGEPHRIHLPRDADNKREVAIFRSNLDKQLRKFGVKLLDPSANRVDIEEQLEGIRGELTANRERCGNIEEMFIEWAGEQEKKLSAFSQDLMARLANQDILIAAALQKRPVESTPIQMQQASQATAPQPALKTQKPSVEPDQKKGMEALEAVQKQQWAEIIERMNADFDLDELDLRILFFLHETGRPQSVHTLREAGVWKPISSATKHLENMEAEGWVVPVAKEWGITKRGISKLQEAYNEGEPEETTTHSSAFKKIEAGLTEALAVARGEPNHAKFVRTPVAPAGPGSDAVKPKPALTVVPQAPRVLKPVNDVRNEPWFKALNYVEKAMVGLLEKDMTIVELQRAIGHTSTWKSLANQMYTADTKKPEIRGCIKHVYGGNDPSFYHLTDKGRAYIQRVVPACKILAAS